MKYLTSILISAVLLLGIFTSQTDAQIVELRQTVYGMDCAPCAYGLENRISKLEGIESATVSLNNSLLKVTFKKENDLTLQEIRNSVKDSGFQPKEAELKLAGIVKKEGDTFVLTTKAGEEFLLTADSREIDTWIDEFPQKVLITGKTEEGQTDKIKLIIQSIDKPAE